MTYDDSIIKRAANQAHDLLAPLGNRWLHVQGVVACAYAIAPMFDPADATCLIASAYLHDIGYAPALYRTGFHPLDGAYYVRDSGYIRLASLVAHHSKADFEARLRGLEETLNLFPRENSAVADALTYCDQTTSPTGNVVSPQERRTEVIARYGETHVVTQALRQAEPFLDRAIERTQNRMRLYGLER